MTRLFGACVLVPTVLFASSPASAQTNTERIRARVKPGQKVSITDDGGQQLHGRIGEMTADALTVLDDGKSAAVGYDRIVTIDRPNDSLANGALIGLGAGATLGLLAVSAYEDEECAPGGVTCSPPAGGYTAGALLFGGLGTAVGVGIDALIHRKREIYRRGSGAVASAGPVLGHGRRGVGMSVTW
jgi:hypothetical protein